MYVCNKCYGVFEKIVVEKNYEYFDTYTCPNQACSGRCVEIDDLLIHVIIHLWKNRWLTNFCCSGHLYESSFHPYVSFRVPIKHFLDSTNILEKYPLLIYNSEHNGIYALENNDNPNIELQLEGQYQFLRFLYELSSIKYPGVKNESRM